MRPRAERGTTRSGATCLRGPRACPVLATWDPEASALRERRGSRRKSLAHQNRRRQATVSHKFMLLCCRTVVRKDRRGFEW